MNHAYPPMDDPAWEQRLAVARWIRIKFEQDNMDTANYRKTCGDQYAFLTKQLEYDAQHSGLLVRLLAGQEPE